MTEKFKQLNNKLEEALRLFEKLKTLRPKRVSSIKITIPKEYEEIEESDSSEEEEDEFERKVDEFIKIILTLDEEERKKVHEAYKESYKELHEKLFKHD
jgi:hypothetical protein